MKPRKLVSFHPSCLVCSVCKETLSGKQFLKEKSGNLVCEECNIKTAPRCTKCKLIFGPGESYKKISETLFYHNHCFVCCGPCHKPIGAEFYDMENEKYLCIDCFDKYGSDFDHASPVSDDTNVPAPTKQIDSKIVSELDVKLKLNDPSVEILPARQREPPASNNSSKPNPTPATNPSAPPAPPSNKPDENLCFKCNEKLVGQYTVYNDKKYHTKCFVCCQCSQPFKEKQFYKLNEKPLCRECHTKNQLEQASKCRKCNKPILDTVVTFKNGEYHDTCLLCQMCSRKLIGQSIYTDKQDKPYCVECFTKKEAKLCAKCLKNIVPSQPSLIFEQKHFHKGFLLDFLST